MKPLFIYPIPQSSTWFIVITDTSNHFYFNSEDDASYWQLSEVAEKYGIDISQFLSEVNYDQLELLFARSRGLKLRKRKRKEERGNGVNLANDPTVPNDGEPDQFEIVYENEYINKASDVVIELSNVQGENRQEKMHSTVGVVTGYSSSEEEEDQEEEDQEEEDQQQKAQTRESVPLLPSLRVKDQDELDDIVTQVLHQQGDDDIQSDNESQVSLDLSVDDDSDDKSVATLEFEKMLSDFSSQISSFDSWEFVEEQLVKEFIKYPVYHSIGSRREKAEIFQNWVDNKESGERTSQSTGLVDEKLFPTEKMLLLSLLQNHKDQVKSSFYQEFYTLHYKALNEIDLSKTTKEEVFRSYKKFILDFAKFEKEFKKSPQYKKGINVKVMKLEEYISSLENFPSGHFTIDPNLSFFDNWINLLNEFITDATIAESEINFLLGDEKRLNSYIAKLVS
ncbi:hypothetical protein KGF57_005288 [Candida theae]|uniref:FF domain-containing protein n=1 Tax=Candida theae TaxID=1198502 RepID=A0AAD5B8X7_9ASCO|nr:uncharacterized protein KGF57_005288 [Candida theae]KAI5948677.1 hypothetical protein KGF57_005288 [Candida theae]